jgi:hypothetical protein
MQGMVYVLVKTPFTRHLAKFCLDKFLYWYKYVSTSTLRLHGTDQFFRFLFGRFRIWSGVARDLVYKLFSRSSPEKHHFCFAFPI